MEIQWRPTRRTLTVISILGPALILPAGADDRIRGEFHRTLAVADQVTVVVRNLVGDLDLRAGANHQLQIHAMISAGTKWDCNHARAEALVKQFEENPAIRKEEDTVYIGVWDNMSNHHCTSERYVIELPASSKLRVETQIGSVAVFDITGPVRVKTGIGEIRLQDPGAFVEAKTGTGSISCVGEPRGDWTLEAGTGGVELRIPREAGFRLDAEAHSPFGSFESDFTRQGRLGKALQHPQMRVRENYNGGGPLVRVRVDKGSIRIRER